MVRTSRGGRLGGHDDFGGLRRDLPHMIGRRDALRWMTGAGLAGLLAACGFNAERGEPTTTAAAGAEIPDEAAGPFPADGSNGPNVLSVDGVVKADLTTSFGNATGTAEGVPVNFELTIVDAAGGDPLPGAVVYLWHCTADGRYSIYEIPDQNYLRGMQAADAAGKVAFSSVFPGCYPGRWPHCHFEVYASAGDATAGAGPMKTSQLALPRRDCEAVYADSRYGNSAASLARLSLDTDGVFRDGWDDQLAVVSGSPAEGYVAGLLVRV